MDARENSAGGAQEPVSKKKKKMRKCIQCRQFCEFLSIYKAGTKSIANNEIFPTVGRNTGENNFYSNIVLFCCWG